MENLNQSNSNISGMMSLKEQVGTGVLGACFLLGVPANVAVVVFLLRHLKRDNFTLHLMLNLAASDILRLLCVPLWIYNLSSTWALGRAFCKLLYLLVFMSSYCSVLTVTLMSVQRYVVVLHRSQWTKLGRKGEKLLLLSLWTLTLILSSPESVQADLAERKSKVCTRTPDEVFLGILLCETLLGFVLPFFVMAMFYFCLHKKVKQSPLSGNPRLARLVIAILFTFLVLGMPCHVMNLKMDSGHAHSRYRKHINRYTPPS
ncbi:leukotriene B4 receptor 1-like [Engraulis encrasicolus]|uniref:leukotriene B4 receptor 1-like n=1 Tax=Engraulis encrasicolus TaxID=184585 RepID=UPI002FCEC9BB